MASFKASALLTIENEGGYSDGGGDFGGETYMGISRRWFGCWDGWARIDELKKKGAIKNGAYNLVDIELVLAFYRHEFWDKLQGDHILDQGIANQLFDHAVSAGPQDAVAILQTLVLAKVDGQMGPSSMALINASITENVRTLRRRFLKARAKYYLGESDKSAQQEANLPSWLARSVKCYSI